MRLVAGLPQLPSCIKGRGNEKKEGKEGKWDRGNGKDPPVSEVR